VGEKWLCPTSLRLPLLLPLLPTPRISPPPPLLLLLPPLLLLLLLPPLLLLLLLPLPLLPPRMLLLLRATSVLIVCSPDAADPQTRVGQDLHHGRRCEDCRAEDGRV